MQRFFLLFEHAIVGIAPTLARAEVKHCLKWTLLQSKQDVFFNYETYTDLISSLSSLFRSENGGNMLT